MRSRLAGCLLVAVAALALPAPTIAQSTFAWWRSDQFQKDLGLSAEQSARIDAVFQSSLPKLKQDKEELDRCEAELSKMIAADAEESQIAHQVDRVEATRAHLNKMRTLMLVHMRQVLTPEQRVKLNALHEQWEKDHKRPSEHGDGHSRQSP